MPTYAVILSSLIIILLRLKYTMSGRKKRRYMNLHFHNSSLTMRGILFRIFLRALQGYIARTDHGQVSQGNLETWLHVNVCISVSVSLIYYHWGLYRMCVLHCICILALLISQLAGSRQLCHSVLSLIHI